MNYTIQEILDQIEAREDSRWEFKQVEFAGGKVRSPKRGALADEIAAFANARGGILLCGVTDDGHVQDLSGNELAALDSLLVELSTDSIKPPVRISTQHVTLPAGKVLTVEIPEGDALHRSPGGGYVRVGGTKREMTTEEELRLAQRRGQARFRWFDKQPVSQTGFGTLEESLWKPMLSAEGRLAPERALQKLALLTANDNGAFEATVAGILLCTSEPERWLPNACITATHYRGLDRSSPQLDAQTITGPLHRQVADAVRFVRRNMRVGAHKAPARTDLPQYSLEAVFEALVNAVAHRDYGIKGSRIRLSMFSNRMEINSPGSLPNNLTIESMVERQATRNEAIASAFARMPVGEIPGSGNRAFFMERRGDGVSIILRATQALSGRFPEYRVVDESDLFLTLPAADTIATPGRAMVSARGGLDPVSGADVFAFFPNGTWKRATTGEDGVAPVDLYSMTLPMTVFVAASGYAGHLEQGWVPYGGGLFVQLRPLADGGSVIFENGTGHLPGLGGRLNPIRDALNRTYLYADNIAVNEGAPQPVHFTLGEELRLMDAHGSAIIGRVVEILGRVALVDYRAV